METTQRETCSSHSNLDSSLSRWRSHDVGWDFSDCKDRPGLYRRKPEYTTLHQRRPYATRAPFLRQLPVVNTIFQVDNARPHRECIVDDLLRMNNVNRMDWPAISPDLSCIELVWDQLGRAVSVRLERNSTLQDLRRLPRKEWARIQTIRKLVYSSKNSP